MQLAVIKDIVLRHGMPIWVNVIVVVTSTIKRPSCFIKHVDSYPLKPSLHCPSLYPRASRKAVFILSLYTAQLRPAFDNGANRDDNRSDAFVN